MCLFLKYIIFATILFLFTATLTKKFGAVNGPILFHYLMSVSAIFEFEYKTNNNFVFRKKKKQNI